ncbi:formyltransferase family protein [Humisphaera borealis]|uniref:Methionyl-tRNA formyltransferase n=1 Tax=Humisphaera borealis TaxID=2807512 RepID=A0A7M2X1C1_9BACT|nr:formyltransferase family protein [Humisphaera borealis]QOV90921.1 methionyl-tRNA formyltransferase [Humisphaera borealis]
MKIFVAGQQYFGAEVLRLCLANSFRVVGAFAPERSVGGQTDRLRAAAAEAGVPCSSELAPEVIPPGTDLIVAAHCHAFISGPVRERSRLGAIGYHPSLLPLHRGRDAIAWALRFRERVTGGTVYWMDDGADTGPIAAQRHVLIQPDDCPAGLWRRALMPLGLLLFSEVLDELAAGRIVRVPQDERLATWEPSLAGHGRLGAV